MSPIEISVGLSGPGVEVFKTRKLEALLLRVARAAGSDGLRAMRTMGSDVVRGKKRFKLGKVRAGLPVHYPKAVKKIGGLVWRMDVEGQLMPVASLPHRQTKRGVSVTINAAGGRKLIKSAFVARMRSGHVGVFRREGGKRLPIREAYTTRLSDVFFDRDTVPKVTSAAIARMSATSRRLMAAELGKLRQGVGANR